MFYNPFTVPAIVAIVVYYFVAKQFPDIKTSYLSSVFISAILFIILNYVFILFFYGSLLGFRYIFDPLGLIISVALPVMFVLSWRKK